MTKLRVLHVLNSTSGGSAASTLQLIEALKAQDVESSLICFRNGTPELRAQISEQLEGRVLFRKLHWMNKRIRARGLKRPLVEALDWKDTWGGYRYLKEMVAFAKAQGAQLVHSSTMLNSEGALVAQRLGLPHIWHGRELIGPGQPFRFYRFKQWRRWVVEHSQAIITNSGVTNALHGQYFPTTHLRLLPNAIALDGFAVKTHQDKTPLVVGMVGNLTSRMKNHSQFVDIAVAALNQGLPLEFRMYGQLPSPEDDYVGGLKDKIAQAGYTDRIRMMGFHPNPTGFMLELDMLLHPTNQESFGRVFIEGMASGLPIIAARGGGALDLVRPEQNGYLYTSPEEALAAIGSLSSDHQLRQQYGEAGRKIVDSEYALPVLAEKIAGLYLEFVG